MSELLPFCKIKLQYLLEMVTDHDLDDNALRVALYLALAHADHETGESRPSFETIGAAIGKHAKSVKRALNKVEAAGYMTVERGTNKGKSSRYRPTEAALKRATERRREGDKVVPLGRGVRRRGLSAFVAFGVDASRCFCPRLLSLGWGTRLCQGVGARSGRRPALDCDAFLAAAC